MASALRLGIVASLLALLAAPLAAHAADDDKAFAQRMAELKKKKETKVFEIAMSPKEDPNVVPVTADGASGLVLVANNRMGIYTPPLISVGDIQAVVSDHMKDFRVCYKKQLDEDPEWADDMILDLAVKKNGRVAEVDVSPGRVRRSTIGQCLMSAVPRWKFPEFTGETDEGITQEVVNASFPFSFSVTER